jgi:peroxiredoxin
MLKIGNQAPRFELPKIDGTSISLADEIDEHQSVLMIFLRHLG